MIINGIIIIEAALYITPTNPERETISSYLPVIRKNQSGKLAAASTVSIVRYFLIFELLLLKMLVFNFFSASILK